MLRALPALLLLSAAPAMAQDYAIEAETVVDGLDHPWSLTFLPDGAMLVTERAGRLRLVRDGALSDAPIGGVPSVFNNRQAGLFDVVLHPDFTENRLVYLSFAQGNTVMNRTAIARGRLSEDATQLEDTDVIFRAEAAKPGGAHYGGRMVFLEDGTLLLTIGEGFIRMDQAQDPANHFGTIVRLTEDGDPAPGNPFADGEEGDEAVWSYGHRNPQAIAIEPSSGDVWEIEHGPRGGDEINRIVAGANYGWPLVSNGSHYDGGEIPDHAEGDGFEGPLLLWTPSIAPSGMAFYDGAEFPAWQGDLFVGALAGSHLRRVDLEDGEIVGEEELLGELGMRIRDVRMGPDGSLYILTDEPEPDGALMRIVRGN